MQYIKEGESLSHLLQSKKLSDQLCLEQRRLSQKRRHSFVLQGSEAGGNVLPFGEEITAKHFFHHLLMKTTRCGFILNLGLSVSTEQNGLPARVTDQADQWLKDPEGTWKDGLEIAGTAALLLETGELMAMWITPTREVERLREREINLNALKELIIKFKNQPEP